MYTYSRKLTDMGGLIISYLRHTILYYIDIENCPATVHDEREREREREREPW